MAAFYIGNPIWPKGQPDYVFFHKGKLCSSFKDSGSHNRQTYFLCFSPSDASAEIIPNPTLKKTEPQVTPLKTASHHASVFLKKLSCRIIFFLISKNRHRLTLLCRFDLKLFNSYQDYTAALCSLDKGGKPPLIEYISVIAERTFEFHYIQIKTRIRSR